MAKLHLQIVTAERKLLEGEADMVIAPGGDGELGILPRHIPIITTLKPGELRVRQNDAEEPFAVAGGFMEVRNSADGSEVIVLADAAERAEDIDLERAQAARQRAEQARAQSQSEIEAVAAETALLRALVRIRVAERYHRTRTTPRR
jgi:F-type H+-transporting ATPase subunit epsilon